MKEYAAFDAMGLAELVRTGEVSSKELLDEAVSRANTAQGDLNCFSALYPDIAEAQLADLPKEGPFAGVPFITKDLGVMIKGAPLTNGSVSWKGHVAAQDSTLTERYRKAGLVMFGMVVAAGISMLSDVKWDRRNMVIFAIALSVGLGLQLDPKAVQYLPDTLRILMTSGLLPAALIAIVLNLVLPEELTDEATEEVSGGMSGHGKGR